MITKNRQSNDTISRMAKVAADGDAGLFDHLDGYMQACADGAALAYLLNSAVTNLNLKAGQ